MRSKQSRQASRRADRQPRDDFGRFKKYDSMMVIDEIGNSGVVPHPSETIFGYAVSVTEDSESFGRISDGNRKTGIAGEIKASRDHENQYRITREISDLGTRTYGYYVDKSDPPKGWNDRSRSKVILKILDYSIDRTLPETRGDVMIVVDRHSSYKNHLRPLIESKSRSWKTVEGDVFDSDAGPFHRQLQTHDYVANAVRGSVEIGDSRRTKILNTKIHRIGNKENLNEK